MIKLYDPNEKREIEFRIELEQGIDCIDLNIVDLDGNLLEVFASITKEGINLYKISSKYAPFKLSHKNYIATKYIY